MNVSSEKQLLTNVTWMHCPNFTLYFKGWK